MPNILTYSMTSLGSWANDHSDQTPLPYPSAIPIPLSAKNMFVHIGELKLLISGNAVMNLQLRKFHGHGFSTLLPLSYLLNVLTIGKYLSQFLSDFNLVLSLYFNYNATGPIVKQIEKRWNNFKLYNFFSIVLHHFGWNTFFSKLKYSYLDNYEVCLCGLKFPTGNSYYILTNPFVSVFLMSWY